jgi:antitoxin component YwqK of YwqJK toxin-antitoxin module
MSIAPPRPPGVPVEAQWIPDDQEWELATRDLEGRRQGTVRRWSFSGAKKSEYEFNDDRIHGPFRRWHDSGETAREGVAVTGTVQGWDRWYRSSGPTSESPFRRDIHPAVGRADYLYEKGEAIRSRYFLNDGAECEMSGEPFPARPAEAAPDDDLTWSPGLGAWYSELSDGTGIERNWSREGKLIKSSECLEGKRHGKTVLYRDDQLRKTHHVFDHPGFAVSAVVRIEGRFTDGTPVVWDCFDARDTKVDVAAELVKQTVARRTATRKRSLTA